MYEDRSDAALALVSCLLPWKGKGGIVLAIPRGGVPVGYPIARALHFGLDVILTKKIGHPQNREMAVGAVSLFGRTLNPKFSVAPEYIEAETERLRYEIREKYKMYTRGAEVPAEVQGKTVILVDDGIATGYTMMATIELLRRREPAKIIVAVPVAPPQAAFRIRQLVDEFVCPLTPAGFYAVGQFYHQFTQVTDEEVISLLQQMNRTLGATG